MIPRLKRLHTILQKTQLDGILVSHQPNITYLTGAPSFDSYLLISPKQNFYITDSRYYQQAHSRLKDFHIKLGGESVFRTIAKLSLDAKVKRLGFEARNLDVAQHHQIKNFLGPIYFVPTHELIEELRKIKQSEELKKIKKAVRITIQALAYVRKIIRPGLKEIEIAAQLEYFIRYKGGARTTSFETIVASGKNSSFPHHLTSGRRLKKEEILFIDVGVDYQGYKSDLTRTFFLGKIPSGITKIYNIVRQAQAQAIKRIKPGVKISDIDQRARQYITKHGYGGFFTHNLGHGIGLEVHEQPHISNRNKTIIEPGMVFTIEPGIYLPNKFGIRIEDDIIVTKSGCEILSADLDK